MTTVIFVTSVCGATCNGDEGCKEIYSTSTTDGWSVNQSGYPYQWAPGKARSDCTAQMICKKGFTTKTIRPPVSYTNKLKADQLKAHPEIDCSKGCEEDHVISLELCGDPRDPMNLSPEPYEPKPGAREKDQVEDWLHRALCKGDMTLDEVQWHITHNWEMVYAGIKRGAKP